MADDFPPIRELIPHAGPAVLVDAVLSDCPEAIEVEALITDKHPFFEPPHGVPAWVGMEMMAQAIAAHAGLSGQREHHAPHRGMLLGTRRYHASVPFFAAGMRLVIRAESEFRGSNGAAACHCVMLHEGKPIAEARLVILEEPS